ncbi:hypothetical protein A1A1_09476 [Planococcus antarcticus DSM 14505]|uniref:Uncharacterized protein n=1 Tax=Planococcus antarcticus DSM 14505 TaxID=1185653 RepID=A0AA87IL94_9BACL|nr:hypothetical protein A1A1_09476 [Planococcus antarcticus DSM 14505]
MGACGSNQREQPASPFPTKITSISLVITSLKDPERKAAKGKDVLLPRCVAKPLSELLSFNDFAAGAVKRHPRDPAGACNEEAGATSLATGATFCAPGPHPVGPKRPLGAQDPV